jgi:sterol desaturase/sphingolipid hydroxylase (fatty acid hydroxylase superfamily)
MGEARGLGEPKRWRAGSSSAIFCRSQWGSGTVDHARRARLLLYAAAAGIAILCLAAAFAVFEPRTTAGLWSFATEYADTKWRRILVSSGGQMLIFTIVLMIMELFFLKWEKTTICGVFVRRNISAITDLGFMIAYLSQFKLLMQYVATLGFAYAAAKLAQLLPPYLGSYRWELPSDGILQITAGFAVFYLVSSFIGYWQHRLMHWRGFWQLHRFHHAATELNILTGYRDNPGEAIGTALVAVSPMIFLKVPDAGLFAAYVLANQIISSLQHSELPWSYGWVGRWLVASPQFHQIHHSIDEEHRDRNFAICPIWDRLFGTCYDGPNRPSAYGIPDPAHVERPLTQWAIDIWIFYRDIMLAMAGMLRRVRIFIAGARPTPRAETPTSIPAE